MFSPFKYFTPQGKKCGLKKSVHTKSAPFVKGWPFILKGKTQILLNHGTHICFRVYASALCQMTAVPPGAGAF